MANESRAFHLINGVNLDDIVKSVTSFLNIEKHMEVQSSPTAQCRQLKIYCSEKTQKIYVF